MHMYSTTNRERERERASIHIINADNTCTSSVFWGHNYSVPLLLRSTFFIHFLFYSPILQGKVEINFVCPLISNRTFKNFSP